MAELQTNVASGVLFYRGRMPRVVESVRKVRRPVVAERPAVEKKAERREEAPKAIAEQAAEASVPKKEGRRAYNREYMREWRKRNQERYREYNREYQRKRHMERKIQRILNAPADEGKLCGYGCGRPAVETIERVDPRTWKSVRMPYCGHC